MKPPFTLAYDEAADVLYIHGSDNRPAYAEEINGVVKRYAEDNRELVGITIISPTEIKDDPEESFKSVG